MLKDHKEKKGIALEELKENMDAVFSKKHFVNILSKPTDKCRIKIDPQVESFNEHFFTMTIIVSV